MTTRRPISIALLSLSLILMVSCVSHPVSIKEKWLKIMPGQTSTEDVRNLLGSPELKAKGLFGEVWCYEPAQSGSGCVEFKDERVLTRSSTVGLNLPANLDPEITSPYTLTNLLRDYGLPSIIYESIAPSDPFGTPLIEQWVFSYPEKGFNATLGYPSNAQLGSTPDLNTSVDTRVFYAPLSISKYRATFPPAMYGSDVREVVDINQYLKSALPH
jgi:hypothetical protein